MGTIYEGIWWERVPGKGSEAGVKQGVVRVLVWPSFIEWCEIPLEDLNKGVICSGFMFLKVISISALRVDGKKRRVEVKRSVKKLLPQSKKEVIVVWPHC